MSWSNEVGEQKKGVGCVTIGIVVLLVAILAGLVGVIWTLNSTARAVGEGVERVQQFGSNLLPKEPTPTVWLTAPAIVHEIQALSQFTTVSYTVEKVVTAENSQTGLWDLLGFDEQLLFVAHGIVHAGIDLSKLTEEDVVVRDGVVYVELPPAEIFIATLDNQKSYVYSHDRGLMNRLTVEQSNLETAARQAAERSIEEAAIEDGILDTAEQNARYYLQAFLMTLGFDQVQFVDSADDGNLPPLPGQPAGTQAAPLATATP